MGWYKVQPKTDEAEYNKALIRLVRVATFLEYRLVQAVLNGDHSVRHLQKFRLTLMIANRTIKAWKDELGIGS